MATFEVQREGHDWRWYLRDADRIVLAEGPPYALAYGYLTRSHALRAIRSVRAAVASNPQIVDLTGE